MQYFGHYRSAVSSLRGCIKEFVSTPQDTLMFPPQVNYLCNMCNNTHAFRLTNTHMVVNPSTAKRFDEFCAKNHVERDVEIPGM